MAKYIMRGEPDLFDLAAWKVYLAELRTDDPSEYRDTLIAYSEAHIRAIEGTPEKSATEAV